VAACVPSCNGKACGADGCGGSCGSCANGQTCDGSGQCVASSCSHPICSSGVRLTSTCDPCASQICAADPYCCTTKWDSICVGEVASVCGQSCGGGGGGGGCSHPICSSGVALTGTCDPCANVICSWDSYCCTTKWDAQCVSEVGSICGQSC
jgi:hypothetical protein